MIDPKTVPLRFSRLKLFSESPLHYYDAIQTEWESTPALRLGTLAHSLLFPDHSKPFAVYDGRRQGNAWKEFQAAHANTPIFTATEVDKARPMAEAIAKHSEAAELITGIVEQRINWHYQGRKAQSTPDVFSPRFVTDVKTSRCTKPERFVRDATFRGYHAQLAFYDMAVTSVLGWAPRELYIVAVESKRPHAVTICKLTHRARSEGEKLIRLWYEQLMVCEQSGNWPGYAQNIVDFDVIDPDADVDLDFGDEDEGEEAAA